MPVLTETNITALLLLTHADQAEDATIAASQCGEDTEGADASVTSVPVPIPQIGIVLDQGDDAKLGLVPLDLPGCDDVAWC